MLSQWSYVVIVLFSTVLITCSSLPTRDQELTSGEHNGERRYGPNDVEALTRIAEIYEELQEMEREYLAESGAISDRNLDSIGGTLLGRNLNGIGGTTLVGRNLNGIGGTTLVGRNLNGLGGTTLVGRNLNGLGGTSLVGRNLYGNHLRSGTLDSIGGGNLLRSLDSIGGGNLLRSLDSIGGGNLLRSLDSIGGGNLLKRGFDFYGSNHPSKGNLDSIGGGNLLRLHDGYPRPARYPIYLGYDPLRQLYDANELYYMKKLNNERVDKRNFDEIDNTLSFQKYLKRYQDEVNHLPYYQGH